MYKIVKTMEISAAHKVMQSCYGKCENLHGHNWKIIVYMKSETLNQDGMVCDFSEIKNIVREKLDHKNLNDILEQPTSENLAKYICDLLGEKCFKVEVQETSGNLASYEIDE